MAFESYPREDMEKLNDTGQIFVLEKRKLDRVPGWSMEVQEVRKGQKLDMENACPPGVFLTSRLTLLESGLHSPPTLLTLCTDFVGAHIEDVESLIDFPEIVGKTLFESATEKRAFDHLLSQGWCSTMQKFAQAYGPLLLNLANLENSSTQISRILPIISSFFCHITELNLTGCALGEKEDLLQHISNYTRLQRLCLQHNHLTDNSLRIITTPVRVLQKGPRDLQILDISRNPCITELAARYLLCFKHLSALDLSGTKFFSRGVQKLEDTLGLEEDADIEEFDGSYQYDTWGWAAPVVREWVREAQQDTSLSNHQEDSQTVSSFYGCRQTKVSRFIHESRERKISVMPPVDPLIRLGKPHHKPSLRIITDGGGDSVTLENKPDRKPNSSELLHRIHEGEKIGKGIAKKCAFIEGPNESILKSYIECPKKKDEQSAHVDGNKRALFSVLSSTPDDIKPYNQLEHQTKSNNNSETQTVPIQCRVSNPRKKRKIVLVANRHENTCENSPSESKPKSDPQRKVSPPKKERSSSLWKAMHSKHW